MNLWFRLLGYLITVWRRPSLNPPLDVSRINFRVWPNDLDTSLHMNNGRYLTLMDMGRLDFMARTGLLRPIFRNGWTPVVSTISVRFRRELRLFRAFCLETRILSWDDTSLIIEHRIVFRGGPEDGQLSAIALAKTGLYDRKVRQFVAIQSLLDTAGIEAECPPLTPEQRHFLETENILRSQGEAVTRQDHNAAQ